MRRSDHQPADPSPGMPAPNERPGDEWICGHFDAGSPCSHGPTARGRCPVRGPCQPAARLAGSAEAGFRCTRPPCSGGPCPMGPEPDGTCGMTPTPCRPRRSWRQRHRLAVRIGSAALLVVLAVAILGPWRREVFAPGPLSDPHAQILSSSVANKGAEQARCAACHSVARGGLASWFRSGGAGHVGVSQTELCIECHHATIQPERAFAAHNLTAEELQLTSIGQREVTQREVTWHDSMPRPSFANDQVECSACHREHGGKGADLTWMSSAQCQSCHQDRFASFAKGHPEWQSWPYGRGGQIAFNHATHQGDHFAKEGKAFDCQSCHSVTTAGEIARSGSFETSCAACHDGSLRLQTGQGIELVALPMLDVDSVREAGIPIPQWPEEASGVDLVSIPPLTRMLLASDPAVGEAIDVLTDPTANRWQGPASPTQLRATATVADAVRTLLDALAEDVGGEVERRLPSSTSLPILGQLSPQSVATARDRWFPSASPRKEASSEAADRKAADASGNRSTRPQPTSDSPLSTPQDDLLLAADELAQGDPLLADPLTDGFRGAEADPGAAAPASSSDREKRFDPARMLPAGGWYRDDRRLAIRYRGAGHADPLLRAIVEFASDTTLAATDRESLLAVPAVAACVDCHPAVRRGENASWRSLRDDAGRRTFTRFSHRPHMHLPALSDCTHCHRVGTAQGATMAGASESALTPASLSPASFPSHGASETSAPTDFAPPDFAPLARATCVQCHTPQAAGDNCTKCHLYHVDR